MAKMLEFYRALPYTRQVRLEVETSGEEYFVASVTELEGVAADGDSPTEALSNLRAAFDDYIAAMLEWGKEIPEPQAWPQSLGWAMEEVAAGAESLIEAATAQGPEEELEWLRDMPTGVIRTASELQTTGA